MREKKEATTKEKELTEKETAKEKETPEEEGAEKVLSAHYLRPPWRAFISIIIGGAAAAGCLYYILFAYELPEIFAPFKLYFYLLPITLFLLSLLTAAVARYSRLYTIAASEISVRYGLLTRDIRAARYDRITDVRLEQNFVQRILKLGDIMCNTAGTAGYELVLSDVWQPYFYLNIIRKRTGVEKVENRRA